MSHVFIPNELTDTWYRHLNNRFSKLAFQKELHIHDLTDHMKEPKYLFCWLLHLNIDRLSRKSCVCCYQICL